jgi:PIN domain nuclease of toxin-antitoxin system
LTMVLDMVQCPRLLERGRIVAEEEPEPFVRGLLRDSPTREATLRHEVALESRRIGLEHPDPADRFLAATARVYELTLVTADARLLQCRGIEVLGNR